MSKLKKAVSCYGVTYPIEAWRIAYDYITKKQTPDNEFERQIESLGVSRPDAYALYFAQLHTPGQVNFAERPPKKRGYAEPALVLKNDEKILVPTRRKK